LQRLHEVEAVAITVPILQALRLPDIDPGEILGTIYGWFSMTIKECVSMLESFVLPSLLTENGRKMAQAYLAIGESKAWMADMLAVGPPVGWAARSGLHRRWTALFSTSPRRVRCVAFSGCQAWIFD
jgi:hypothetical protein